MNEITIYRDIAVPVVAKIVHIRKIGGRLRHAFVRTWGDLPIGTVRLMIAVRRIPTTDAHVTHTRAVLVVVLAHASKP